jgi:hypothetical protein
MGLIAESWRGERPLGTVFWGYYVGFYIVYFVCLGLLIAVAPEPLRLFVIIPGVLLLGPYGIWIIVSIWRCAANANSIAKFAARIWIVLAIIGGIGAIAASSIEQYQDYLHRAKKQGELPRPN